MRHYLSLIVAGFLLIGFLSAPIAQGAGLVPCTGDQANPCTFPCIFTLIHNIFNFLVLEITPALSVVAFIVGGVLLMFAGANEQLRARGKRTLSLTLLGVTIVLLSWVIVNTTINVLAGFGVEETTPGQPKGFPWPWNKPPGCGVSSPGCYEECLKEGNTPTECNGLPSC
jgi:hypothetical protein